MTLPQKCPASKKGRACIAVPNDPIAFANFCLMNEMSIEDVTALAPAWIFDIHGNKAGSKSYPWRVTDYISAFYMVKNPIAMRNRLPMSKRVKAMSWKPGAGDQTSGPEEMTCSLGPAADVSSYRADPAEGAVLLKAEVGDGSEVAVKQET
jgi:hypothetical protein